MTEKNYVDFASITGIQVPEHMSNSQALLKSVGDVVASQQLTELMPGFFETVSRLVKSSEYCTQVTTPRRKLHVHLFFWTSQYKSLLDIQVAGLNVL